MVFLFLKYLHFCPDFLVMQKNSLIRKLRSISKFLTSQTGQKIIRIHTLPNISSSKANQTMKFGQLINWKVRNIFLKKSYKEDQFQRLVPRTSWRLVPDLFFIFEKSFYKVKASGLHLSFNIFWQISTWTYNPNKPSNISGFMLLIQRYAQF